jgi:hypothetical protein
MTALDTRLAADLSDRDLERLVRLVRVFVDDPEYELRHDHVREQWAELTAQDHGQGAHHHDSRREELAARRKRGALT